MEKIYTIKRRLVFFVLSICLFTANAQDPVQFILVDADANSDIQLLNSSDTVYYSNTHHINIRAEYAPYPDSTQYIDFLVNDKPFRTEVVSPFALQGDRSGDYLPYFPSEANQVITARIGRFDIVGGILTEGSIFVHFIDTTGVVPSVPSISSFILVNAETNEDIRELHDGDFFNISQLPPLNIRVTGNIPSTGSVLFNVGNNNYYKTENKAPYAVYGDIDGDYMAGNFGPVDYPGLGNYTTFLTATPFTGPNGSGIKGKSVTIEYTVIFGQGSNSIAAKISAYPNPAKSEVFVSIDDGGEQVELQLFDSMGKVFYNDRVSSSLVSINLEQLNVPKGYYFLKVVYSDKSVKVIQLIKN